MARGSGGTKVTLLHQQILLQEKKRGEHGPEKKDAGMELTLGSNFHSSRRIRVKCGHGGPHWEGRESKTRASVD